MISSADPTMYLLVAASLMALSGVPGLLLNNHMAGQRIAALLVLVASLLGESAVVALLGGSPGADAVPTDASLAETQPDNLFETPGTDLSELPDDGTQKD